MNKKQKKNKDKPTSDVLIEKMENLIDKSTASKDIDELLDVLYKQRDIIALGISALENSKITPEELNQLDDLSKIVIENAAGTIKKMVTK